MPGFRVRSNSPIACVGGLVVLSLAVAPAMLGCVGDEPAPDCFERDQDDQCVIPEPDGPLAALALDCGDLAATAVNAQYDETLDLSGGSGSYQVVTDGLPDGLSASNTGAITGSPTQTGVFTFSVTANDLETQESAQASCEITVNPALSFDHNSQPRACIDVDDFSDVRDALTGGTGEDIVCTLPQPASPSDTCPLRSGNGLMPGGVSFDDASCTVSGSVSDDAVGTWVWMVKLEQSGATVFVPVCASREDTGAAHSIETTFAGTTDYLQPAIVEFDPSNAVSIGSSDPSFTVRGADCTGGACNNYAFSFAVTCSPFCSSGEAQPDGGTCQNGFSLAPDAILNEGGINTGFTHEMSASTEIAVEAWNGSEVDTTWSTRPWVANWTLQYCTSDQTCDASSNPQTTYNYSVVAFPQ